MDSLSHSLPVVLHGTEKVLVCVLGCSHQAWGSNCCGLSDALSDGRVGGRRRQWYAPVHQWLRRKVLPSLAQS